MEDYELVLLREPVRLNIALWLLLLAVAYLAVSAALLVRVCLHVGRRRR